MEYIPVCDPYGEFPNEYCYSCPHLMVPCDDMFRGDVEEWYCGYVGTEYAEENE